MNHNKLFLRKKLKKKSKSPQTSRKLHYFANQNSINDNKFIARVVHFHKALSML